MPYAFNPFTGSFDYYQPSASAGSGLTSVGLTVDSTLTSIFANSSGAVTGSPLTSNGAFTLTLSNQTTNKFFAAPNGSTGAPTFRAIVAADIPTLNQNTSGTAAGLSATLAIASGGTAATTAAAALTSLGAAPVASPVFTGSVKFGNYHIEPSENNAGNSSTAITVDLSTGSAQKITLTGNATFALSNPQTGGAYVLKLVQDATGSRTVTWPTTVKWPGGTAPTLTTTAGQVDLVNLYWDSTDYFGSYSLNYTP